MHELTAAQSKALLAAGEVAHVAVLSADEPYVTPVSYVVVGDDVFFRTGPGRRLEAVRQGARACLEVTRMQPDSAHWDCVLVWGETSVVEDEQLATEVATRLLAKYRSRIPSPLAFSWTPPATPAVTVRIAVDTVTGRASSGGFGPDLRPGRF